MGTRTRSQTTRAPYLKQISLDGSFHRLGDSSRTSHDIIDDDDYQEADEYANARSVKSCQFDAYYDGSLDLQPFRINFLQI